MIGKILKPFKFVLLSALFLNILFANKPACLDDINNKKIQDNLKKDGSTLITDCADDFPNLFITITNLDDPRNIIAITHEPKTSKGYALKNITQHAQREERVTGNETIMAVNGSTWEAKDVKAWNAFITNPRFLNDIGYKRGGYATRPTGTVHSKGTILYSRGNSGEPDEVLGEAVIGFSKNKGKGTKAKLFDRVAGTPEIPPLYAFNVDNTSTSIMKYGNATNVHEKNNVASSIGVGFYKGMHVLVTLSPQGWFWNKTFQPYYEIFNHFDVTDAISLDGGTASSLYYKGAHKNPIKNHPKLEGNSRDIMYALTVSRTKICDDLPHEPIEMTEGAIDIKLSWTCANNINMDLTMEGPRDIVKQDVKDVENLGLEHAYVKNEHQIRPGDLFTLNAKGNKLEESELEESYLDTEPIDIYAVLRTPTGTYFEQYEAKNFEQLNIGDFAEIEVKDKIEYTRVCKALKNPPEPNWYNLPYKDREGFQCIHCKEKSNIKWRAPVFKYVWRFNSHCQLEQVKVKVKNGEYYCDIPETCPDSPSYHDLPNKDTGKNQCLYCPKPNTVRWRPTQYVQKRISCGKKSKEWEEKINGTWYCDSQTTRIYNECKDGEKKGSCGCVDCEYIVKGMRNALEYGPIEGASVKIVEAQEYTNPNASVIYRGTTTVDRDIFKAGLINLTASDKAKFDDEKYYIIFAKGGEDVDRDDDLIRDTSPTVNNGTVHAIIKGSDIKQMSFRVNVLTEAVFQVSGGVIGSEYNATVLSNKLDDAAKKLLNTKLYPTDVNQEIVYRDVLLWAPAVDKKALYKPYDTFVEPIVLKTYSASPRFDESYTLIYEPYDSGAPLLTPMTLKIPEGLPNNTPIGIVVVQNDKTFASVALEGKYAEYFSVDSDGIIRIAESSSIHNGHNYRFQMRAIDSSGREGSFVGLTIQVGEGMHQANLSTSVPSLVSFETFDIVENSPEGTLVANTVFEDSNQTIVGYRLTGEDNNSFAVDDQGVVTVSANADIDYEKLKIYRFSISAYNDVGNESYPVSISINVSNEIDTPLYPLVFFRHLEENTPIETTIGKLETLREGLSGIDSFDILSPDIPFDIDNNGTITVSDYIDFEQDAEFEFIAIAYTKHGKSNKIQCQIIIDNQEPEIGIPTLEDLTIVVDENITSGSKMGKLVLNAGATAIERIALYGEDDNFRVDNNGSIYLANHASLDYELKTQYILGARALNSRGWGNEVRITITVKNVADTLPTFDLFRESIEENASAQTFVGTLSLVSSEESNITGFTLTGAGSENFTIDENGTIRVSSSATLDYETVRRYALKATVRNNAREGEPIDVRIYILNIPENPPVLKPLTLSIEENASIGTVVGMVQEDVGGDSPILSYRLTNTEFIDIDSNGTLILKQDINYSITPFINLQAYASNSAGESNASDINITVQQMLYNGDSTENTLIGSSRDEIFDAKGGNDTIQSGGGDDSVTGGKGNDIIIDEGGDDSYHYTLGDGNDTIEDHRGEDILYIHGTQKEKCRYEISGRDMVIVVENNETITLKNWADNNYKIETFMFDDGQSVTMDEFDHPIVKADAGIVDLSKLGNTHAEMVVQGFVRPLEGGYDAVDHWVFHYEGGQLIIDILSELASNGHTYIDIDGDGKQTGLDVYIYLFKKDQNANWITVRGNDDSSAGTADGSSHSYDSYLSLDLEEGEYMLSVSNYALSASVALTEKNSAQGYPHGGPYQITFNTALEFSAFPDNANNNLYGSDHYNFYVLRNDLDPYNVDELYILNPEIFDENGTRSNSMGRAESMGNYLSYYPEDTFSESNTSHGLNIVYVVSNKNGIECRSLLSLQLIPDMYMHVDTKVNRDIWATIKEDCPMDLNISKGK